MKTEKFIICPDCRKELESEYVLTYYWWAKTKCSFCGRSGEDLFRIGRSLLVASKKLKGKENNER